MNEKDRKKFLEDFKKVELPKKLDMWYFALEQESIWDEILSDMSEIANKKQLEKGK